MTMQRREFLQAAAAAAGVSVLPGCATTAGGALVLTETRNRSSDRFSSGSLLDNTRRLFATAPAR